MLAASQSKSNFLKMFEHNIDNQPLIASNTACHLPTVTEKKQKNKKQNKQWHKQLSRSIQRWMCALKTGGLLFWQTKGSASLITAQEVWSRCRASSAMIWGPCFCDRVWETESRRMGELKTFIPFDVYFSYFARLSRQPCKTFVKVINLRRDNHAACCRRWRVFCKMQLWFQRAQEGQHGTSCWDVCGK